MLVYLWFIYGFVAVKAHTTESLSDLPPAFILLRPRGPGQSGPPQAVAGLELPAGPCWAGRGARPRLLAGCRPDLGRPLGEGISDTFGRDGGPWRHPALPPPQAVPSPGLSWRPGRGASAAPGAERGGLPGSGGGRASFPPRPSPPPRGV